MVAHAVIVNREGRVIRAFDAAGGRFLGGNTIELLGCRLRFFSTNQVAGIDIQMSPTRLVLRRAIVPAYINY